MSNLVKVSCHSLAGSFEYDHSLWYPPAAWAAASHCVSFCIIFLLVLLWSLRQHQVVICHQDLSRPHWS